MRNVAWISSASISQNLTSNFSSLRFEHMLPERSYNAMQNRYRDISEDGKIIQMNMEHSLLLLLRNATKHNSIKLSATGLHVSSDKFWNFLKDLKCNNVKNSCLLVNKRTLPRLNYKRTFVKHLSLKNVKNSKRNLQNQHIFTMHEMHVASRILVHHHSFQFFSTILPS